MQRLTGSNQWFSAHAVYVEAERKLEWMIGAPENAMLCLQEFECSDDRALGEDGES
mgnify:FL=1